jgi:hypothetical protein
MRLLNLRPLLAWLVLSLCSVSFRLGAVSAALDEPLANAAPVR